jgi:hypothetical protein
MKKAAAFALSAVLIVACCSLVQAQYQPTYKEQARAGRKSARPQSRANNKYAKQQQKAMRKSAKAQRKALKKTRRRSTR